MSGLVLFDNVKILKYLKDINVAQCVTLISKSFTKNYKLKNLNILLFKINFLNLNFLCFLNFKIILNILFL